MNGQNDAKGADELDCDNNRDISHQGCVQRVVEVVPPRPHNGVSIAPILRRVKFSVWGLSPISNGLQSQQNSRNALRSECATHHDISCNEDGAKVNAGRSSATRASPTAQLRCAVMAGETMALDLLLTDSSRCPTPSPTST